MAGWHRSGDCNLAYTGNSLFLPCKGQERWVKMLTGMSTLFNSTSWMPISHCKAALVIFVTPTLDIHKLYKYLLVETYGCGHGIFHSGHCLLYSLLNTAGELHLRRSEGAPIQTWRRAAVHQKLKYGLSWLCASSYITGAHYFPLWAPCSTLSSNMTELGIPWTM